MPIRRILKVVREQYDSLQKRFGNNTSDKKETTAAVADADAPADEQPAAEEAPIAASAVKSEVAA